MLYNFNIKLLFIFIYTSSLFASDNAQFHNAIQAIKSNQIGSFRNFINNDKSGALLQTQDLLGYTLLHHAVLLGNYDICKILFAQQNFNVSKQNICDETPLILAIMSTVIATTPKSLAKYDAIACDLIDKMDSRDLDLVTSKGGSSALHVAIQNKRKIVIEKLLSKNVNITLSDNDGCTPLMLALDKANQAEDVKKAAEYDDLACKLIDSMDVKDLNVLVTKHSISLLDFAVTRARRVVVEKLLLKKNIDIALKAKDNGTPLMSAILHAKDNKNVAEWDAIACKLIDNMDISSLNLVITNNKASALHLAVSAGRGAIVEKLLSRNVDVSLLDKDGCTPLMVALDKAYLAENVKSAAEYDNLACKLIDNMDIKDLNGVLTKDGLPVLSMAIAKARRVVVEKLLSRSVNISLQDKNGCTPLMIVLDKAYLAEDEKSAAEYDNLACKLIDNTDIKDLNGVLTKNGLPVLSVAIAKARRVVVEKLLSRNVNISLQDNGGKVPLVYAISTAYSAKDNKSAAEWDAIACDLIEKMDSRDLDLVAADEGYSVLHVAIATARRVIVEKLLSRDINVSLQDNRGYTPLKIALDQAYQSEEKKDEKSAAEYDNLACKLIDDMDIKDLNGVLTKDGLPVLSFAIGKARRVVVKKLLSRNVNVSLQNNGGKTPLIYAIGTAYSAKDNKSAAEWDAIACDLIEKMDSRDLGLVTTNEGYSVLHTAVLLNRKVVVEKLLSRNVNIVLSNKDGDTPLMVALDQAYYSEEEKSAAEYDHLACKLIDNMDIKDLNGVLTKDGLPVLSFAIGKARRVVVEKLLSRNVNISLQDNGGKVPLVYAIGTAYSAKDNKSAAEWDAIACDLIEKMDSRDLGLVAADEGYSVLHGAVLLNRRVVVEKLLSRDINVSLQDNRGCTPLMIALDRAHKVKDEKSLAEYDDIACALLDKMSEQCLEEQIDKSNCSLLNCAATTPLKNLVRRLFDKKLSIGIRSSEKRVFLEMLPLIKDQELCRRIQRQLDFVPQKEVVENYEMQSTPALLQDVQDVQSLPGRRIKNHSIDKPTLNILQAHDNKKAVSRNVSFAVQTESWQLDDLQREYKALQNKITQMQKSFEEKITVCEERYKQNLEKESEKSKQLEIESAQLQSKLNNLRSGFSKKQNNEGQDKKRSDGLHKKLSDSEKKLKNLVAMLTLDDNPRIEVAQCHVRGMVQQVNVDVSHISEAMIDVSGGHLSGCTEELENLGIVQVKNKQNMGGGCVKFIIQTKGTQEDINTEFPSSWTPQNLQEKLFDINNNTIQEYEDNGSVVQLQNTPDGFVLKKIFRPDERTNTLKLITAYPVERKEKSSKNVNDDE